MEKNNLHTIWMGQVCEDSSTERIHSYLTISGRQWDTFVCSFFNCVVVLSQNKKLHYLSSLPII